MLNCGHSYCIDCLKDILPKDHAKKKQIELQCPSCQQQIKLAKMSGIEGPQMWLGGLIKNYALISLVEAQKNLEQMNKIKK